MSTAPNSRPQPVAYRPAGLSFAYFLALTTVSAVLYSNGVNGNELWKLASLVVSPLAVIQLKKAVEDKFVQIAHDLKIAEFKKKSTDFGDSHFATWKEIKECPYLSETEGIFVGTFTDEAGVQHDMRIPGDSNINVTAPPGSMKTMCLICTAIFGGLKSFVCHDPSGEIIAIVFWFLKKLNYKILIVTPMIEQLREITGIAELQAIGLDIFSEVNKETRSEFKRTKLEAALERLIPYRADLNENSKYFFRLARKICLHLCLRMISMQGHVSLVGLREQIMLGMDGVSDLYVEDEEEENLQEVVKELGRTLGGLLSKASPQYAGGDDLARQHTEIFDPDSCFGKFVSGPSFDPSCAKDPNQKVAIFVHYPMEYMESHEAQISLTFTYLFDTIAADMQKGVCTILMDECGACNLPKLADALNFYRKRGLRFELIWQDEYGQTRKKYGELGHQQIKTACQVKIGMNLVEQRSLNEFSEQCGKKSILKNSLNDRANMAQTLPDLAPGMDYQEMPLIRPGEIRTLPANKMLMIVQNCPPILFDKLPYWEREEWRKIAGVSPYYRGESGC